ncbi:hypothetical protein ACFXAZ_00775 [Streptomyces sp. NPDC059477]|uniref:hypothetical protein n=1 Tax=Streptomyces sp. NPDC059477 TaxID=3346847 RepID=UPI0036A14CB5
MAGPTTPPSTRCCRTPARETYELLGCAPQGALRTAVARARAEGSAPLGSLPLEILDRQGTAVGEWYLEEVRVSGARPCARDLSLLDVTVEGWTPEDNPRDHPRYPPLSPGYRTLSASGEPYGTCRDLAHVRPATPQPPEPAPVRLAPCAPPWTRESGRRARPS